MKLSKAQERVLKLMTGQDWILEWSSLNGRFVLGGWQKIHANTVYALMARDYIQRRESWPSKGGYEITDAGREALAESSPAGGR